MFCSNVPIMIVPMIWLVAWDVMHGGWLGPTMVLWCYWRLRGTVYLVWLFCCYDVISIHCNFTYVHCDVAFSMFITTMVYIDRCSSFLVVYALECSFLDLCGSGTPQCGGSFLRIGWLFSFKCFLSFLGNHLSAWCNILNYRTPIETVSYNTRKVLHSHINSVVWY